MREELLDELELETEGDSPLFDISLFKEKTDPVLVFSMILTSALIIVYSIKFRIFQLWLEFLFSNSFLKISIYPLLISLVAIIAGIIFRTVLWLRYKPEKIAHEENIDWPFVSVIMPAWNEEESVEKSIDSIFSSNYPQDKLEVICVNDGSIDLTLFYMLRAKRKYGERVKIINFERNLGKRKALYAGLKKSKGEIIVTVDTDSEIGRSAIRNIVIPLIQDEMTGAVAGRVAVLNEKENFLTRMLSVRYSISFNFGRAYQSKYGAVFCCPGALTAYRKTVVQTFIKEWVNQKFLNALCTHGEDRGLTTQILKAGYMTRFQSNAIVYTKVPSNFFQMIRMYLRWTRSYIRESILFAGFMFTKYRTKYRVLPVLDFFFENILHPFHVFSITILGYIFIINPLFILRYMGFMALFSFLISLYNLRTSKSLSFLYGIPYALFTAFFLWWIVPFAAFSVKSQSWLTR
jgi:hyaluronan synthase